jgi:hypothetical protein
MINYRDLLLRRHGVAWLVLAALAIELASTPASAQQSEPRLGLCFDIIPARQNLRPEGAFLLNRCTGQTWLLTRIDPARARNPAAVGYRWSLLAADDVEMTRPSPPPEARVPVPAHPSTEKCFNFQGRQFCE